MTETEHKQILEKWLEQHKTLVFKVVRSFAFSKAEREDLFQEILIQIWRSIPGFKKQSALTTWLYRVSLNTALSWSRKERKYSDSRQSLEQNEQLLQVSEKPLDERIHWLYEEISKLNEIDRSLILLLLDGFSYREMSGILGISESNVGVKINRIKKYLSKRSEK